MYIIYVFILIAKNQYNKSVKTFKNRCEFIAGAASYHQVPDTNLPEFAFVGRSNVGKSSLINTLVYRKSLVRTSKTPGCTKQINFFELEDKLILVDLPGYGYARISKSERSNWDMLIHDYLRKRARLKRIFLLIDSRHELKSVDLKTMDYLDEYGLSYQVVLTKIDKSTSFEKMRAKIKSLLPKHPACHPEIILTSSMKDLGIDEVRREILELAE